MGLRKMSYRLDEVQIRLAEGSCLYSDEPLSTPASAARMMQKELSKYDREVLCVVNLNTKLRPINYNLASMGSINSAVLDISCLFKSIILSNAACFMVFHNHPSHDLAASEQDILGTEKIIKAGIIMGIPCLDHIIIGSAEGSYFSFRESGLIEFSNGERIQRQSNSYSGT